MVMEELVLVEEVVVNTFGPTRRGLRTNVGRTRRLQVVYSPDTVVIDKLEDICEFRNRLFVE